MLDSGYYSRSLNDEIFGMVAPMGTALRWTTDPVGYKASVI